MVNHTPKLNGPERVQNSIVQNSIMYSWESDANEGIHIIISPTKFAMNVALHLQCFNKKITPKETCNLQVETTKTLLCCLQ